MKRRKKGIIVGAGPAGLFAAWRLAGKAEVTVIEKGKDIYDRHCPSHDRCIKCPSCGIIEGVGGAGGMSDGKLNLHPKIGGDLTEFITLEAAEALIDQVDRVFVEFGAPPANQSDPAPLLRRAASCGIEFIPARQRHIGSDRLPSLIHQFKESLINKGVQFILQSRVEDIIVQNNRCKGVCLGNVEIEADSVILAPGRAGSSWLAQLAHKYQLPTRHEPIDVGVRVEVPAVCYDEAVQVNWDPKFRLRTPTYDDLVRTFCTNPCGFVIRETYGANGTGVNGHALHFQHSENTNFAFLVKVDLTEPLEDTSAYGHSISHLAYTIGGGAPIIQRLGDLKQGRRSTWNRIDHSYVRPTLRVVTPGDISMALPHRIVTDIIEGLDMLDKVIPGVASGSTLLYAPEIKFSALRIITDKTLGSKIKGLYLAGDGAGLSRDIINAAITGIIAADGIIGVTPIGATTH
ncbi:MAG: FAD-dependent oxidoreductase [Nitrospinae bacterium RIFCSPLOWO2_12_FULL_45_22]|nr:MAG: FAD-dependent oxidoreductase [Nitrospinae bacterium RIFCSPLOWO2_12_FULL_45_22]